MPITKKTWTFEYEGRTYTLAPIGAQAQAEAMDLAHAGKLHQALLLCTGASLRSWTDGDATESRPNVDDLTIAQRAAIGDEVFARCILRSEDQD